MAIFNSFLYVYQRVVVQPSQESRSMIQDPLSCRFIIPCWNLQRCWYSQKKCQTMGYTPYKYGVYCILHINMDIFPCFIYLYPYLYPYTPYIYIYIYGTPVFWRPAYSRNKNQTDRFSSAPSVIWICLQGTLRQVSMGWFLTESLHRKPWILPAILHNITFYVHI